jgi:hypothetical protein
VLTAMRITRKRVEIAAPVIVAGALITIPLAIIVKDVINGLPISGAYFGLAFPNIVTSCTTAFYFLSPGPSEDVPPRDRIAETRNHMNTTGRILCELEDELSTRIKNLEQLQTDAERYERLASLNAEHAKAIEDMVGQQFKRQSRATWWQWWTAIFLAAVLGFIVNWASTPLWEWLTH